MKKGFVFMETLIVLVVLTITIVGMYSTYINISTNINNRMYYDNISDLYKTEIIRNEINKESIGNDKLITITKDTCTTYMSTNCNNLLTNLNIENIYITNEAISSYIENNEIKINNSMREYLKTINKDETRRNIIVNFKYGNKNYYASLRI